jgi:hypothetical protein
MTAPSPSSDTMSTAVDSIQNTHTAQKKWIRNGAIWVVVNNRIAARFWMSVALILAAWGFASPLWMASTMKEQEKVVILDSGGTLIYSAVLGFEEAGQLHAYHARLAALAFLQRNPNGLDLPELFERVFIEPARSEASRLLALNEREFSEKQIHQKCEITRIDIMESRRLKDGEGRSCEAISVKSNGNLVRIGSLGEMEFRETAEFELILEFVRNPDLLKNGLLPLVVYGVQYSEKFL